MKKLVIFYSWSGKTEKYAKALAEEIGADIQEVTDYLKPGVLKAYTLGCFAAMRMKRWETDPIGADLSEYDHITVMSPVWAGYPAPAINNVFDLLPRGKKIAVRMVSASGKSQAEDKIRALVRSKSCDLIEYVDVKAQ